MSKASLQRGYLQPLPQERNANLIANVFLGLAILICAGLLFFSLALSPRLVVGTSMYPTLNSEGADKSDLVYILKSSSYKSQQIIVLHSDSSSSSDLIKRVIGLPGDTIEIKNENGEYYIYVNSKKLDEPYINSRSSMQRTYNNFMALSEVSGGKLIVGEDRVFYLGDNRASSYDCSSYGTKPISYIEGKVLLIVPYGKTLFQSKIIW